MQLWWESQDAGWGRLGRAAGMCMEPGDYKRDQLSSVLRKWREKAVACKPNSSIWKKKKIYVIAVLKINPNLKLTVWSSLVHHNDFIFILSTGICFYCLLSSVKHLIAPLRQLSVLTTLVTVWGVSCTVDPFHHFNVILDWTLYFLFFQNLHSEEIINSLNCNSKFSLTLFRTHCI